MQILFGFPKMTDYEYYSASQKLTKYQIPVWEITNTNDIQFEKLPEYEWYLVWENHLNPNIISFQKVTRIQLQILIFGLKYLNDIRIPNYSLTFARLSQQFENGESSSKKDLLLPKGFSKHGKKKERHNFCHALLTRPLGQSRSGLARWAFRLLGLARSWLRTTMSPSINVPWRALPSRTLTNGNEKNK